MDKQAVVDKIVDKYRVFKKQIDAYIKDICVKEKREAVAYFCKDEVWATLDKQCQDRLTALNDVRMQPVRDEIRKEQEKEREREMERELMR